MGEFDYAQVEGALEAPVLPILIFRKGMKSSVKTLAMVDTGLDEGLLLSRDVRDVIFVEGGPPETHEPLWAGVVEIPCEVYLVSAKLVDKWVSVKAYAPIFGGYETLIGRLLLNAVNLCLRGSARKVCVATE